MADPIVFDSALTNPGGTANNLTVALSTHAVDDILLIFLPKTGNASWTVPAGYLPIDQRSVGNASNGVHGSWFARKIVSGDTLPLADPVCSLGATVTRAAACLTIRNADLEGIFVLPEWGARGFSTGTANPVSPPDLTTLAPGMLVITGYGQRSATDAPDPSGYTQDEEAVISGTLVMNVAHKTVTDQNTLLSGQDASPTAGARWVAGILCIPSADYPYYRSGSQALTASGTSVTGALPSGTSASDWRGNKDCIIATVEAAGTPTIAPQTPADWTEITGQAGTTSGNGSTIRRYFTLYDGSVDPIFTRNTTGEIAVCLTTYRNTHQTVPIGNSNVRQNASSTTSTWDALTRSRTKVAVIASCVADGTPTYTAPSGWAERMDGNGIACADQIYNAIGSSASASFILSAASPTLVGLLEITGVSSIAPIVVTPTNTSLTLTTFTPSIQFATRVTPGSASLTTTSFVPQLLLRITPSTQTSTISTFAPRLLITLTPSPANLFLSSFAPILNTAITPPAATSSLTTFVPDVIATNDITVTPDSAALTLTTFEPSIINTTPKYRSSAANASTLGTINPSLTVNAETGDLIVVFAFVSGNVNDTPTCSDSLSGAYDLIDVMNVQIDAVDYRLSIFVRTALITETSLPSITVATGSNTSRTLHIYMISGMQRAGSAAVRSKGGENDQAAGTPAPTLNQTSLSSGITLVACGSADTTTTEPSGWIERHDTNAGAPTIALATATRDTGFTGTAITFGAAQDTKFCSYALELDTSSVGVSVTPTTISLTLSTFAPQLLTAVTPATELLTASTFAPLLQSSVTPATVSLSLSTFSPSIAISITVPSVPLLLTTFAPTANAAAHVTVTPTTAALTLTSFTAVLNETVTPTTQTLSTTTFAPKLVETLTPTSTSLLLSTFAPALAEQITPSTVSLTLNTFAPTITVSADITVQPPTTTLTLEAFAPKLSETITPTTASLSFDTFAPLVTTNTILTPAASSLVLTGFALTLHETTTPSAPSLLLTTFAPSVVLGDNVTVEPPSASLTVDRFSPSLVITVTPTNQPLALTTFTPTVAINTILTPASASLTLATFNPQLREVVIVGAASFSLTTFAPSVEINVIVTIAASSLVLNTFAPALREQLTPDTVLLTLTTFAPAISADVAITPTPASLTLTTFAPDIVVTGDATFTPDVAMLTLTGFTPSLQLLITPAASTLLLSTFTPTITISADKVAQPASATFVLETFAPQLQLTMTPASAMLAMSMSAPSLQLMVQPASTALVLSTFIPTVSISADITITPAQTNLTLTTFAPIVTTGAVITTITPTVATLTLTSYAPWLFLGLVPARRTYVVNSGKYEVEVSAGEYEFVDNYEDDEVLV